MLAPIHSVMFWCYQVEDMIEEVLAEEVDMEEEAVVVVGTHLAAEVVVEEDMGEELI